jgi:hypothetical protein
MLFQASNFADVSSMWGIGFTIWNPATAPSKSVKLDIILNTKRLDEETFSIKPIGEKTIYSPEESIPEWVCKSVEYKWTPSIRLSSAVIHKKDDLGKNVEGSFGWMLNMSNSVYKNGTDVSLFSSRYSHNGAAGLPVLPANFRRVVALFIARKSIERTWINWQDEYLIPHASEPSSPLNAEYEQWVNDAIVYSLFNSKSNQSSLRKIDYKGKKWDILNHFFFMSSKEMKEWADSSGFQEMYADCKAFGEDRFVYKTLEGLTLSDDARDVLETARVIVRASMGMRKAWHQDHPELHLQAWDAGWAQLKPMLKVAYKDDYKEFVGRYKAFESRMREGVYKFGFLK